MNGKEEIYSQKDNFTKDICNNIELETDDLVIDETTIYEIDRECLKKRRL